MHKKLTTFTHLFPKINRLQFFFHRPKLHLISKIRNLIIMKKKRKRLILAPLHHFNND